MSVPFTSVKSKLGLDDVLGFGRHQGYTVLEILKDRPEYIAWLIAEGKQFYESVHKELAIYRSIKFKPNLKRSLGGYNHEIGDYVFDDALFNSLFDDVPF